MRDRREVIFVSVMLGLVLGVGIWVSFIADCSKLGWLPLKDLPARCLR